MREQYKYSLWTPCKTLQYRKVFANAMVEATGIPLLQLWGVSSKEIICENGYCNNKPDWCPLKELPKEENGDEDLCSFDRGWTAGFNTCMRRIMGEQ